MSNKTRIKAPVLKSGDTLGVIALSSSCEPGRFRNGLSFLKSLGFNTKIALDPCKYYGSKEHLFSSDGAKRRAVALTTLFKDKSVKAIISARGAYGAVETLPYFDFKVAKLNPKPLIGFSDTTAMLVALRQVAGCPTIHGPSVESFYNVAEKVEKQQSGLALKECLMNPDWNPTEGWKLERLQGRMKIRAEVLGGNLSLLATMCGTPWQPKLGGKILFLEEIGERPYRLHRMLLQLLQSGALVGAKGVILGSFRDCEHPDASTPTVIEAIMNIISKLKIPIWRGVPAGHEPLNLPIPYGVPVEIE